VTAVLGLLIVFCAVAILVGLIKPSAVIRWGNPEKRKRGKVLLTYGAALIVLVIVIGTTTESQTTDSKVVNAQQNDEKKPEEPAEPAESVEKANEIATEDADPAEASTDERLTPEWNMEEPDALENGNFYLAVDLVNTLGTIPDGEAVPAEDVLKTPWNYYGKALTFTGAVEDVQDFPPGSEDYKAGRQSDVVITADDGTTTVEFFIMGPSGGIHVGQTVTMTGYPIGRTQVENTLGGSYTHLIVVTNKAN